MEMEDCVYQNINRIFLVPAFWVLASFSLDTQRVKIARFLLKSGNDFCCLLSYSVPGSQIVGKHVSERHVFTLSQSLTISEPGTGYVFLTDQPFSQPLEKDSMSNRDGDRCVPPIRAAASRERDWGTNESVVVRAIASHQRGPGSNSSVDIICGLSLLLAHTAIRPRMVDEETLCGCAISKSLLT